MHVVHTYSMSLHSNDVFFERLLYQCSLAKLLRSNNYPFHKCLKLSRLYTSSDKFKNKLALMATFDDCGIFLETLDRDKPYVVFRII